MTDNQQALFGEPVRPIKATKSFLLGGHRPGTAELAGRMDRMGTEQRFDGRTYEPEQDAARLTGQMLAVFDRVQDGTWWSLERLSDATGYPEASVSARLRDLRKPKFGGHDIERRRVDGGLFLYRFRATGAPLTPGAHEVAPGAQEMGEGRI